MAYKEKRREERFNVDMRCIAGVDCVDMDVVDISLHGISIIGDADFKEEQPIDITVKCDNGGDIKLRAVVKNSIIWDGAYRYGTQIVQDSEEWMHLVYGYMIKNK